MVCLSKSKTDNLPDMRGQSLRGVDDGEGIDPDAASRYAKNGGNTGDMVGTYQDDEFKSHSHGVEDAYYAENTSNNSSYYGNNGIYDSDNDLFTRSINTDSIGGNETRIKNVAVYYLISCGVNDGVTDSVNLCE